MEKNEISALDLTIAAATLLESLHITDGYGYIFSYTAKTRKDLANKIYQILSTIKIENIES